jgi:hypothetical protein
MDPHTDETLPLFITAIGDTAIISSVHPVPVEKGVVVRLAPGEEFRGIPYAAWEARRGDRVDIEEFRREYEQFGIREPMPEPPTRVKCPRCVFEMEPGVVSVDSTFFDYLVAGYSSMHLLFEVATSGERHEILSTGVPYRAFRCAECGSVYIE